MYKKKFKKCTKIYTPADEKSCMIWTRLLHHNLEEKRVSMATAEFKKTIKFNGYSLENSKQILNFTEFLKQN